MLRIGRETYFKYRIAIHSNLNHLVPRKRIGCITDQQDYSMGHLPYPSSVLEPSPCILKFVVIMQMHVAFQVDEQPEAFRIYLAES